MSPTLDERPPDASAAAPDAQSWLEPAAVLLPGARDATALVVTWLVRRSFPWMLLLGIAVGGLVTRATEDSNEFRLDTSSPYAIAGGVLTPFSLVFVALIVRVATAWIALALAVPAARRYHGGPTTAERSSRSVATFWDRLLVARAFRALRWTRDVRETAFGRLGAAGQRAARLDRAITVANVAAGVVCAVVIGVLGATIQV